MTRQNDRCPHGHTGLPAHPRQKAPCPPPAVSYQVPIPAPFTEPEGTALKDEVLEVIEPEGDGTWDSNRDGFIPESLQWPPSRRAGLPGAGPRRLDQEEKEEEEEGGGGSAGPPAAVAGSACPLCPPPAPRADGRRAGLPGRSRPRADLTPRAWDASGMRVLRPCGSSRLGSGRWS